MEKFGSPLNTVNGPTEHSLIDFAKNPAKRAHKKQSVFVQQVCQRWHETMLIAKAKKALELSKKSMYADNICDHKQDIELQTVSSELIGNPMFQLLFRPNQYPRTKAEVLLLARDDIAMNWKLSNCVVDWFNDQFLIVGSSIYNCETIDIFTEYKRDGQIICAHPNHNSYGPWYDWVMIEFNIDWDIESVPSETDSNECSGEFGHSLFPAKVICYYWTNLCNEIMSLVHSCTINWHKDSTVLFEHWQKEYQNSDDGHFLIPVVTNVSVDSFSDPVFVVEDNPTLEKIERNKTKKYNWGVTVVLPYDTCWPDKFLQREP